MSDIVQKLWGFCHTLRHDGIDYGDYIEQITYLLFVKMADERGIDLSEMSIVGSDGKRKTVDCSWPTLSLKSGTELTDHFQDTLRWLGQQEGILGDIFGQALSRFTNPVNLKKLIGLVDDIEWTGLDIEVMAAAFEGLLEKAASEGKKGAGQYFTPRLLIQSIVSCMKPDPRVHKEFKICDPACGTGGFLVVAWEWFMKATADGAKIKREAIDRIRKDTYFGQDLVPRPRRLALMNMYLHGLTPKISLGDSIYEAPSDRNTYDVVLTNPPFGTKGANQAPDREDLTITTSNKQLNFLQHVMSVLRLGGRAAVVVPDNCLFADQAGDVFEILTEDCDLHTVLRLPNGTFTPYSPGTKTNVIFFTKGSPTKQVWIYDARTNVPRITKKDRPLTAEYFAEFEKCFGTDPNGRAKRTEGDSPASKGYLGGDRWRKFTMAEVRERDFKLDGFKWLKDESGDNGDISAEPEELATDAISELEAAVSELNAIVLLLENGNGKAAHPTITGEQD